jgi:HlyD family secretion protein
VLGEMDAVDLDERIAAQQAAINSSQAAVRQAEAKQVFAQAQAKRYENLRAVGSTSEEQVSTKRQELAIANAALAAAREDTVRLRAELEALQAQRNNLRLVAPVAGLVAARDADPGTTVVAGQAVVEVIDPTSLWVDTRFDQISADGLAPGLSASITLRSRHAQPLPGQVMRVELRADSVTEETLAKVIFNTTPELLPPLGELAEVTVQLGELAETPVIPNAAIRTVEGQRGVWTLTQGELAFVPVTLGRTDLQGRIQVLSGLSAGDQIIVYSEKAIRATSRLQVVERLAGVAP